MKKILLALMLLLIIPSAFAAEKYSYENAEQLKPLINWRDYGSDSFNQAVKYNKPIFLLLTAPSWCYWCQVYESEDYLFNPQVVNYINENFIPVYVDADKRQDLTRQYLEGGWPSTTILTPSGKRIDGFSGPRPPNVMISILQKSVLYVKNNGTNIHFSYNYNPAPMHIPTIQELSNIDSGYVNYATQLYDSVYGGFGNGQKFSQPRTLDLLLDKYSLTGDTKYLLIVKNTLNNEYTNVSKILTDYNLFDPIEGGFHRYGTKRDYTPPHYEKMLYDNARLLKTYYHLTIVDKNNAIAQEVVDKTIIMLMQWYDNNGGFAGNTDASPEEKYYGLINRSPALKPRLEKTKYTDWNSEAIITFMYLWNHTHNVTYKEMSIKTLDFYKNNMITNNGAYHYITPLGEKNVTGSLTDNAYLLLAFTEASKTFNDTSYVNTAEKLANYTISQLYDWNSSGFFERHSTDVSLYAPYENINLEKPSEENGIMICSLLELYDITKNPVYLDVAIRTLGTSENSMGGLDRGYYYAKSAEKIINGNYLVEFEKNKDKMDQIYENNLKIFWLNDVLKPQSVYKNNNSSLITLFIIALIAGFISFVSPCTLPILPGYIAYSLRTERRNIFLMSITFFLGLSIVFTILGMTATIIGGTIRSHMPLFTEIAGAFILLLGIYILFGGSFSGFNIHSKKSSTLIGAFFVGMILGLAWTPCIGPILVSILILASTSNSVYIGGFLLFTFAIGLSIPLLIVSFFLARKSKDNIIWRILKGKMLQINIFHKSIEIHTNTLISGLLFIILGIAIMTGMMTMLNQYIVSGTIQKTMFNIESWLIKLF